ncbi:MAG: putative toxin-antitoxin system toxin component, PIN family [Thermodesulfobacteriota bacterium]|nr:putative toxin-antitoxin system toxin component, PIN family [Thermodesulfobacteriota bacterium]
MKTVCDTNVLISGILFPGNPRRILQAASQGVITICISAEILHEAQEVLLRPKFGLHAEEVANIIGLLADTFHLVAPATRVRAVQADPDDDRILEAALAAGADFIVSGDRHLLALGKWRRVPIVSPARFVENSLGPPSEPADVKK